MKRGFTVVELVIVIAVIAILATITALSYNSVRQGAAMAKVNTDLAAINDGIKIFHAKKGYYPVSNDGIESCHGHTAFANLVGEYIDKVPEAPCQTWEWGTSDSWYYTSDGEDYKLIFYDSEHFKDIKDQIPSGMNDPARPSNNPGEWPCWGFWTPGAASW